MKLKVKAASRIAAPRMPSYTRWRVYSQLCAFAVVVSLLALPLAGGESQKIQILTPLATELVPLGATLQSQPHIPLGFPAFATATRVILGILSASCLVPGAPNGRGFN